MIRGGSSTSKLPGRDIILEFYTEVGMVTAGNIVPSVQIPDRKDLKENEEVQCKSAQAELSEVETTQKETDLEDILQKVKLSGIADWDPTIQLESHGLICEYVLYLLTE